MASTPNFRPELLTKDIVYCFRRECPYSSKCLRHLAYEHAPAFLSHDFLDPRTTAQGSDCTYYMSNEVQRLGRGFQRAFRLIPQGQVHHFQSRLYYELECRRSMFYNYLNGKRTLSPEQQSAVREVFEEVGVVQEDLFDAYEEGYLLRE